jgi:hypothetical protein
LWATTNGDVDMMRALIEDGGAQILKPRKDGVTVLHVAACMNHVKALNYAIKTKTTASIDILSEEVLIQRLDILGLHSRPFSSSERVYGCAESAD